MRQGQLIFSPIHADRRVAFSNANLFLPTTFVPFHFVIISPCDGRPRRERIDERSEAKPSPTQGTWNPGSLTQMRSYFGGVGFRRSR